jgi:hypothetical protein
MDNQDDGYSEYFVTIPQEAGKVAQFTIKGRTKITMDGASVNSALTMTLTITPIDTITYKSNVTTSATAE